MTSLRDATVVAAISTIRILHLPASRIIKNACCQFQGHTSDRQVLWVRLFSGYRFRGWFDGKSKGQPPICRVSKKKTSALLTLRGQAFQTGSTGEGKVQQPQVLAGFLLDVFSSSQIAGSLLQLRESFGFFGKQILGKDEVSSRDIRANSFRLRAGNFSWADTNGLLQSHECGPNIKNQSPPRNAVNMNTRAPQIGTNPMFASTRLGQHVNQLCHRHSSYSLLGVQIAFALYGLHQQPLKTP